MRVGPEAEDGHGGAVARLLRRMRRSAFQGRKLGEAFEAWTGMIDGESLICLGLAGSLSSAGLWPLVTWLVERGYVDVIASTSANVTEDLLDQRGARIVQVDPERVDDEALWREGFYRFYDHVVSAADYDAMEDFTRGFFEDLAARWPAPSISGVRFMNELGRWLEAQGLRGALTATCHRHAVPVFVPAAPDGPLAEGYRAAGRATPVVDFFRDYQIALTMMNRFMSPGPGTAAIFLGGGVPKDFLQIIATSVHAIRGGGAEPCPHRAAIQITTDSAVYGGLGGASVAGECISWGKESASGVNVMLYADVTIALPILCEALLDHYGPRHVRPARAAIQPELARILASA
ncbi:MAG TPA: deoxyhypusine synthase family protein [Candidatus Tectomicrobia bacterium]|nr:deoxyhypusine synthase family protein [Candidatus Tectomicrobia bacterium]